MKVAFHSDIHGNAIAFRKYRELVQHVDVHYFLGDAVGYMPDGASVVDALMALNVVGIRGNHEAMILGAQESTVAQESVYRLGPTRAALHDRAQAWLADLPESRELTLGGCTFLLVHGSPWNSVFGYEYEEKIDERFDTLSADVVVMAHTHRPFLIRRPSGQIIANCGSIGLPRDVGNSGSYLLFDTDSRTIELRRFLLDDSSMHASYGPLVHDSVRECWARRGTPKASSSTCEFVVFPKDAR